MMIVLTLKTPPRSTVHHPEPSHAASCVVAVVAVASKLMTPSTPAAVTEPASCAAPVVCFLSATFVCVLSSTNTSLKDRHWPGAARTVTKRACRVAFSVCAAVNGFTLIGARDVEKDSVVTVAEEPTDTSVDAPSGANSVTRPLPDVMPVAYAASMRFTK